MINSPDMHPRIVSVWYRVRNNAVRLNPRSGERGYGLNQTTSGCMYQARGDDL